MIQPKPASIGFIDIKKSDNGFERESFEITQIVIEKTGGINESTHNIFDCDVEKDLIHNEINKFICDNIKH